MTTNFDAATRNLAAEDNGEETVVAEAGLLERAQAMVPDALKQFNYRGAAASLALMLTWYSMPDWNRSRASRFLMKSGLIAGQVGLVFASSLAPKRLDFDRPLDRVPELFDAQNPENVYAGEDQVVSPDAARLNAIAAVAGAAGRLVKGGLARFGVGEAEPLSDEEVRTAAGMGILAAAGTAVLGVSESLIYRFGKRRQLRGRKFAYTLPAVAIATVSALGDFAVDNVEKINAIYLERHPEAAGGCGGCGDDCGCGDGGCGGAGECDGQGGCGNGGCTGHEAAASENTAAVNTPPAPQAAAAQAGGQGNVGSTN